MCSCFTWLKLTDTSLVGQNQLMYSFLEEMQTLSAWALWVEVEVEMKGF